jgi:leukotriene A-4 hydrolase/aminopeptidase
MGSCTNKTSIVDVVIPDAIDIHSYANTKEASITHLNLSLEVDFDQQILSGSATYDLSLDSAATDIIFDLNGLIIDSIVLIHADQHSTPVFEIGETKPYLGAPLKIHLSEPADQVMIHYHTGAGAAALQWLQPEQTYGKKHPYLFTQGQAVLTRTWIPIQDGPGIRFTYEATIKVPSDLLALMSATNPQEKNAEGLYHFVMDKPIPAYLMALAVGDISFSPISQRSGVYSEPGMIEAAAYELADMEKMISAAEDLFGPYRWDRYDLIVLPPSFPFGGMENPKLTFATPTIIAGDRSLTSLVAHELAHSWSGNLVTNATWEDFWLNEGHTVYLERRIMEKLYGKTYADMLALLGYEDLKKTIDDFGDQNADTHLKLLLSDRDPDEGMNDIAYEKGYLLLRTIEEQVGRAVFDQFLKTYFDRFAFQSISTEQWQAYIKSHLLDSLKLDFDLDKWLYKPGLPEQHANIQSDRFSKVNDRVKEFVRIGRLDKSDTRDWSSHEWLHFIRQLPSNLHESFYKKLDDIFQFSDSGNSEILAAWLELSIRSKYLRNHNQKQLEDFLVHVGRRKFLTPLYRALRETDELPLAKSIFAKAKNNYHSVAAKSIADLLDAETPAI